MSFQSCLPLYAHFLRPAIFAEDRDQAVLTGEIDSGEAKSLQFRQSAASRQPHSALLHPTLCRNPVLCDTRAQAPHCRAPENPQRIGAGGRPSRSRRGIILQSQAYSQTAHSGPGELHAEFPQPLRHCKCRDQPRLIEFDRSRTPQPPPRTCIVRSSLPGLRARNHFIQHPSERLCVSRESDHEARPGVANYIQAAAQLLRQQFN